jgi:hypothetical protein
MSFLSLKDCPKLCRAAGLRLAGSTKLIHYKQNPEEVLHD